MLVCWKNKKIKKRLWEEFFFRKKVEANYYQVKPDGSVNPDKGRMCG
jgi:hypothetical protein